MLLAILSFLFLAHAADPFAEETKELINQLVANGANRATITAQWKATRPGDPLPPSLQETARHQDWPVEFVQRVHQLVEVITAGAGVTGEDREALSLLLCQRSLGTYDSGGTSVVDPYEGRNEAPPSRQRRKPHNYPQMKRLIERLVEKYEGKLPGFRELPVEDQLLFEAVLFHMKRRHNWVKNSDFAAEVRDVLDQWMQARMPPYLRELEKRIRRVDGSLDPKYVGPEGLIRLADEHYSGSMGNPWAHASRLLSQEEMSALNWGKYFMGSTADFRDARSRLLGPGGRPDPKYAGRDGYRKYAVEFTDGHMGKAYNHASAVLTRAEMEALDWGHSFKGTAKQYHDLRSRLWKGGTAAAAYAGPAGYRRYAEEYHDGNMAFTHQLASAALSDAEMRELGWGKAFEGTASQHARLYETLFGRGAAPIERFWGREGYRRYAAEHFGGDMNKAHRQAAAVLTAEKWNALGWGKLFIGNENEYRAIRNRLFDGRGKVRPEYHGEEGYQKYADEFTDGQMARARAMVSAALTDADFEALGWGKAFPGDTTQHRETHDRLFPTEEAHSPYAGVDGYRRYADAFTGGNMDRAYRAASAVLDADEMKALGWGKKFPGSTSLHKDIEKKIARSRDRAKYAGVDGYVAFADQFAGGQMSRAFTLLSALLPPAEFKAMGWGTVFSGTTTEFKAIKARVIGPDGRPWEEYRGPAGYRAYARNFTDGQMARAHDTVAKVLGETAFEALGWGRQFPGTADEHEALRNKVFTPGGSVRAQYRGVEGYRRFADDVTGGKMDKAYTYASSGLGAGAFEQLGWGKLYRGTTKEHAAIRAQVIGADGIKREFVGTEGYLAFADQHAGGNMSLAFQRLSAVLTPEEFAALGWGKHFPGTTAEYRPMRSRLFEGGVVRAGMHGPGGLDAFAALYFRGNRARAHTAALVVLGPDFALLNWGTGLAARQCRVVSESAATP